MHIKFLISQKHPKMTSAGSQNDSTWVQNASTWANLGATWLQNGPASPKHWPKCPHLAPKWLHLGPPWGYFGRALQKAPKMIPTCVQDAPKMVPKGSPNDTKQIQNDPKMVLLNIWIGTTWNREMETERWKNIGLGTTWK